MIKKILVLFVLLVAGFCVYVAMKPSEYRIERTAVINASPEELFPMVNNFRKFNEWSPWAKIDPNSTAEFSGAPEGVGARFRWAGNHEVGKGTMTITESTPYKRVEMQLDFKEPMDDTATVEFLLKPEGAGTHVTWAIFGSDGFISKAICVFMDRDKMVGDMYEKGFENLRRLKDAG